MKSDYTLAARAASFERGSAAGSRISPPPGSRCTAGPWPELVRSAFLLPLKGAGGSASRAFSSRARVRVGCSTSRTGPSSVWSPDRSPRLIADAQAVEAERRRAEALAEIDRAKTTFFSNVSHEFRTPLTLMFGPIEDAAANPATPAPVRAQLELAHRNCLRLLKLVNSLLDFSRIEAGRVQASYESVDLARLTRDLASTFRSAMERAGLAYIDRLCRAR